LHALTAKTEPELAGAACKNFVGIASEVKALAEKPTGATDDISSQIIVIQDAA